MEEFFQAHGHSNITLQNQNYPKLYTWIQGQRKSYAKNRLSKEVIERMEACLFIWNSQQYELDTLWNKQYNALLKIFQETGTTIFQRNDSNKTLHNLGLKPSVKYKRNEILTEEQIKKTGCPRFMWEILQPNWEEALCTKLQPLKRKKRAL